jgi:hypothetical protein
MADHLAMVRRPRLVTAVKVFESENPHVVASIHFTRESAVRGVNQ